MRKILISTILLINASSIYGQYGNEWIDFNQSYFKISLAESGIYRITQNDLLNVGFPVSSVDPRRIQLFYRGIEQAVILDGQQDEIFDPTDFIEFYGQRNDGQNETVLYPDPTAQPHTKYSLFSDSSAYFLTWKLSPQNGKRATSFSEKNVTNIPKEAFHFKSNLVINSSEYNLGITYSSGDVILSSFDFGEGWTGQDVSLGKSIDYTLSNIINTVPSANKPSLGVLLTGQNNLSHNIDILVGPSPSNLRILGNAQFSGYNSNLFTSEIEWADISAQGDLVVRISVLGVNGAADRAAVAFIDLKYAQSTDMETANTKLFELVPNAGDKSFIEVINSPGNVRLYDITDTNNLQRIGINYQTAILFDAVISSTMNGKRLIATNSALSSFKIQSVDFQAINPSNYDYILLTHEDLMQSTSTGLSDPVEAYRDYRESQEGGAHKVYVAEINNLYNQFNYGEYSPLAIRRFVNFMLQGNLDNLFIIGEALDMLQNPFRKTTEQLAASNLAHLVPTMGVPGSDIALTAGLGNSVFESPIATGRITARTPDDVLAYLDKVIEMEQASFDNLGRKTLIHLSGGTTPSELVSFKSSVDGFKAIAESDFLGGHVETVSKQSSSPVELFNISDAVNKGVGLITFFGHSGPNGSDVDIGRVSDPNFGYTNKGKYPSIIVNGCNSGDVFGTVESLGEDWILTPEKGAICYIAHSDNGLSFQLKRYTDQLYDVGFGDSLYINQSVGKIKIEASRRFIEIFGSSSSAIAQVQQFVLQGDPAVHLFGTNLPDYAIDPNNLYVTSFDGEPVNALTDSFSVNFIVKNYGVTSSKPLQASVIRHFNNGSTTTFGPIFFEPVSFQDTLGITINSISGQSGVGNNQFEVIIDEDDAITEINETNNSALIDFFINAGATINLFPKNFGVESSNPVKFITQTSDLLSDKRSFILEIDTTKTFNSPLLRHLEDDFKVLAEWDINLSPSQDTTVFFWRTKFKEPKPNEDNVYTESSFTYIENSPEGWAQTIFSQFDLLDQNGLKKDEISNSWEYEQTNLDALIRTHGTTKFVEGPVIYDSLSLLLNAAEYLVDFRTNLICRSNSINAIAFDQSTLFAYLVFGINTTQDRQKCGKTPFIINNILESQISGTALKLNAYIDGVKDGDFIILFSIGELKYEWKPEVIAKLASIGVSSAFLNGLTTGQPLIIVAQKGLSEGNAIAITGTSSESISLSNILEGSATNGSLKTSRIGPASMWEEFFNKVSISETPQTDTYSFDIIAIDRQGNENEVFSGISGSSANLSSIDADIFPFLKVRYDNSDVINKTPPQLKKWQVTFKGVSEGILLTSDPQILENDNIELQAGADFETNYYFKNISDIDFPDSLNVRLSVFNQDQRSTSFRDIKLPAIVSEDSAIFNFPVNTLEILGVNDMNVFVNQSLQPEVTINNNILNLSGFLTVKGDLTNPILDVTFDGIYILDGDIIAPNPNILIRLKDENPYLFKQDTTGIDISLKRPYETGCDFERINFSSPEMIITTATENTDFQITYNPVNLTDGIYTLRVQASDASGNQSGVQPYQINFEVINESTITNFYPYPNPFSTNTRFVFTLTGSEIPDQIKIQIMTVSGKIVREITQDELGPIKIGNNLTDFAWDGRDEFGDQLATGVYLYKVSLRSNGQRIERRNTSADRAFKNGFGKIYLLR
ncbi:MAG: C25 family cysteine peptidase [Bacteroidetes bacterium]|nr:C25 family cysteine peptidase [Bacteroidota bacterium]